MGETIARNKKALHDMPREKIVPCGTILADKVSSIEDIQTAKESFNG